MTHEDIRAQLDRLREKLQMVEENVRGSVHEYETHYQAVKKQADERAKEQARESADLKCQLAMFNDLTKELLSAYKSGDKTALEDVVLKFTSMVT